MTLEPSRCHTVAIRPCLPPKTTRTLADYQAPIIARFGRLPSWPELAKLERQGSTIITPVQAPLPVTPMTIAARAAIVAKGEATRASIMAALTKPMTCPDVANVIRRTRQLTQRHLQILASQGRITGHKVKGVTVWEVKA
jgi:hypothetical protein